METRRLGRTGLEVPALCMGTMTFGLQTEAADAPEAEVLTHRERAIA